MFLNQLNVFSSTPPCLSSLSLLLAWCKWWRTSSLSMLTRNLSSRANWFATERCRFQTVGSPLPHTPFENSKSSSVSHACFHADHACPRHHWHFFTFIKTWLNSAPISPSGTILSMSINWRHWATSVHTFPWAARKQMHSRKAKHLRCLSDYLLKVEWCGEENRSCAGPPGDILCPTEGSRDFSRLSSRLPVRRGAGVQMEDVKDINTKLAHKWQTDSLVQETHYYSHSFRL